MSAPYQAVVVRVFVRDWERALRFYTEALGMPLASRSDPFGWAELATGGCSLALERVDPSDPEAAALLGRCVGLSLRVPDLARCYETLRARGVEFLAPPERQAWGGTLAHLRDPEGNVLTLLG
jgi:catechol 2,3-dioxygenase-like lactoylglutathione lyase family enzyme